MPSELVRELLRVPAAIPVAVVPSDPEADTVTVKGFASVEIEDRSGDLVAPEEFDIDQFMAAPSLMVNHKLWVDPMGNGVAVGRPMEMYASKLVDIGSDDNWGVYDLKTRELVNEYPKVKVPKLKAGDRGLFVVVEVTEYDVVKMVKRGELSSFSWRGLVQVDYQTNPDGTVSRVLKNIDLYEISLVNVADNPSSTFMVGKMVAGKFEGEPSEDTLAVHVVRLDKSRFETEVMALEYLKNHDLDSESVRSTDEAWFARQKPADDFSSLNDLVSVKMSDGVFVVAGPLTARFSPRKGLKDPQQHWIGQLLGSEAAENLTNLYSPGSAGEDASKDGHTSSAKEKTMADDAADKGQTDDQTDAGEDKETTETQETQTDVEKGLAKLADDVSTKTAKAVAEAIEPLFGGVTESLKTVSTGLEQISSKMATVEPDADTETATKDADETETETDETENTEDTETEPDGDTKTIEKTLAGLTDGLTKLNDKVAEVAKTAEGLAKAAPSGTERDEKVETEKTGEKDPNNCFDSTFAFLGGSE